MGSKPAAHTLIVSRMIFARFPSLDAAVAGSVGGRAGEVRIELRLHRGGASEGLLAPLRSWTKLAFGLEVGFMIVINEALKFRKIT